MPTSTHAAHCHCHGTPAHSKPPLHAPTLTISASARLAQPAERKALNLVVVGTSPTVGVSAMASIFMCDLHDERAERCTHDTLLTYS